MKYLNYSATKGVVTNEVIIAADATKRHRIHSISVVCSEASVVKVTIGDDGANGRLIYGAFGANGGQQLGPFQYGPLDTEINEAIKVSNSAGTVYLVVLYQTE